MNDMNEKTLDSIEQTVDALAREVALIDRRKARFIREAVIAMAAASVARHGYYSHHDILHQAEQLWDSIPLEYR